MGETATSSRRAAFRRRLLAGERLIGTFIKTPTAHATEILGDLGFDFVVIDQEHAPFDRPAIDTVLLATRAADIGGIVRVPEANASAILSAFDCGATGVLVPHVASPDMARDVGAWCRYRGGRRGFSNSPRAGGYGRLGIWDHVDAADAETTAIAMIEDPEALDAIDAIVAVEALDGVFIGRADLAVALGASGTNAAEVRAATERIAAAARKAGKAVCAMTSGGEDARWLQELGVAGMIVASDQGFLRQAAAQALASLRELGS